MKVSYELIFITPLPLPRLTSSVAMFKGAEEVTKLGQSVLKSHTTIDFHIVLPQTFVFEVNTTLVDLF